LVHIHASHLTLVNSRIAPGGSDYLVTLGDTELAG